MVRITAFFIMGTLLGIYMPDIISTEVASWLFIFFLLLFAFGYFLPRTSTTKSIVAGLVGLFAVYVAGFINILHHTETRKADHLTHIKSIEAYSAKVKSLPEEKIKSWKVEVVVDAVKLKDEWIPATGNVLIYFSKQSGRIDLKYGDQILVKGAPIPLESPANPHEFDFRRFLTFRNIYHQQFVRSENIHFIAQAQRKGFLFYSQQARTWASLKMKEFVHGGQEQAIALALVLGVRDGLDNDLQNAYSASGAMHVLAVSGLHVGILYWIILLLLKPIRSVSYSPWLIAIISLVCLWAYAFITGLSPSVLRAVTMFSFVALAKPFSRSTNIYNTLAASAFILLLYDPYIIMSVGFQLSYLAVIGIVYLQRPLYNLWDPQNKFLDWCWSISCVSISAQIATFTLGLLYFHQFPLYFLFSNLFVIPGSILVLALGILLFAVSFLSPFALVVGWLLEWSIKIVNMGVFAVEDLPYSLISGIYLTTFQCWLLMATIVTIILLIKFKRFYYLIAGFLFVLIYSGIQWQHYINDVNKTQFVVYKVNGHSAMEWIDHGSSYFYSDSSLLNDTERIRFHIQPNRVASGVGVVGIDDSLFTKTSGGLRYFKFHKKSMLLLDRKYTSLPNKVSADYLIIGNNAVSSLDKINDRIQFQHVILDSSNSMAYSKKIVNDAKSKNISVHSVLIHGAYSIIL
ncbi:MAG: ComEC family competence protein [Bacteroidia bacterium]|nr:ComEC family competence protein [Bacteroidia bacterium]